MRLYIIILAQLESGPRCAQTAHAAFQFAHEHPSVERDWFESSNNVVVLQDPDLAATADMLEAQGIPTTRVHEPDLGNMLTAVAAGPQAQHLLRKHELAS